MSRRRSLVLALGAAVVTYKIARLVPADDKQEQAAAGT